MTTKTWATGMRHACARLAAISLCLFVSAGAGAGDSGVAEGQPAPAFRLPALDGGAPVALADQRGKVVYLDFWASWCAPCAVSLPLLDELSREFPAKDFQVVAVNVDHDTARARDFLARRPVGFRSASDPDGMLPERFGISTMPTSFLIDRDGVVRHVHAGFRKSDVDGLRALIRELTAAPPAQRAK